MPGHVYPMRTLIDDNFGAFNGEAFAVTGFRTAALVGWDNLNDTFKYMNATNDPFLFGLGCGGFIISVLELTVGGSYTSASGVGTSTSMKTSNPRIAFALLFGSYFGDWDNQNNFLRSAIASDYTLTSSWSGRPHWMIHHMVETCKFPLIARE